MPSKKIWFLRSFLLCLIGILLVLLSFMLVKFDFKKLGEVEEYKIVEKNINIHEIEVIHLHEKRANLKIKRSEDDRVHLKYAESKNAYSEMLIFKNQKELTLERNQKIKMNLNPFTKLAAPIIETVLEVPDNIMLDLHMDIGNIIINSINVNTISIHSNVGNVTVENVEADHMKIEMLTGDFYGEKSNIKELDCHTHTGNIKMKLLSKRKQYQIYANSSIEGIFYNDREVQEKKINVKTDVGSISLSFDES